MHIESRRGQELSSAEVSNITLHPEWRLQHVSVESPCAGRLTIWRRRRADAHGWSTAKLVSNDEEVYRNTLRRLDEIFVEESGIMHW